MSAGAPVEHYNILYIILCLLATNFAGIVKLEETPHCYVTGTKSQWAHPLFQNKGLKFRKSSFKIPYETNPNC